MRIIKKATDKAENTPSIEAEIYGLRAEKDDLSKQVTDLQKEIHRLKIERDIYEKTAEIIKKTRALV